MGFWQELSFIFQLPQASSKMSKAATDVEKAEIEFEICNLSENSFICLFILPTNILLEDNSAVVSSSPEWELFQIFLLTIHHVLCRVTESDKDMAKLLHAEYLDSIEQEKKMNDPKRKFGCNYCDFRAITSVGLKKHLNKEHPYKDWNNWWTCKYSVIL